MCKHCGQETAPCQCGGLPRDTDDALVYAALVLDEMAQKQSHRTSGSPSASYWSAQAAAYTERAKLCAALATAGRYLSLGVPRQRALACIT